MFWLSKRLKLKGRALLAVALFVLLLPVLALAGVIYGIYYLIVGPKAAQTKTSDRGPP